MPDTNRRSSEHVELTSDWWNRSFFITNDARGLLMGKRGSRWYSEIRYAGYLKLPVEQTKHVLTPICIQRYQSGDARCCTRRRTGASRCPYAVVGPLNAGWYYKQISQGKGGHEMELLMWKFHILSSSLRSFQVLCQSGIAYDVLTSLSS